MCSQIWGNVPPGQFSIAHLLKPKVGILAFNSPSFQKKKIMTTSMRHQYLKKKLQKVMLILMVKPYSFKKYYTIALWQCNT